MLGEGAEEEDSVVDFVRLGHNFQIIIQNIRRRLI